MNDGRKLLVALVLVAGVVLVARRARAAALERELAPLEAPDLGPIRIDGGPPLELDGDFGITAPASGFARVLGELGADVTDALKTLGLWSRRVPEKYRAMFAAAGADSRLPPSLLEAVAYQESRFREDIITGQVRSSAGAVGIMQIVPRWHPELGEAGALDPRQAVPYAARYLRRLFNRFGNWPHAIAAYNWGQGNLGKALEAGVPFEKWPKETRSYVFNITTNAGLA